MEVGRPVAPAYPQAVPNGINSLIMRQGDLTTGRDRLAQMTGQAYATAQRVHCSLNDGHHMSHAVIE
jgi:hypothetical protein